MQLPALAAICPHCRRPFDSMGLPWTCPACNSFEPHHSVMLNCEHCGFGPRLVPCPNCHQLIESELLMFSVSGPKKAVLPYGEFRGTGVFRYKLIDSELKATRRHRMDAEQLSAIGKEALTAMFNVEFESRIRFPLYQLQSHCKSSDGVHWLHVWALKTEDDNEALAQIVFRYPGASGGGAQVRIIDVLVDG